MSSEAPSYSYDEHPYPIVTLSQMDPGRLAAIARLFGVRAPDPAHARVLELGCAQGGTLIPLADKYPRSEFVGVDLSAPQIEQGRRVVADAGLRNIDLQARDILEVDRAAFGDFDYILTNGVYSYVPDAVKARILEVCGGQLRAGGLCYFEHNTFPGWKFRHAAREMMLYHVRRAEDGSQVAPLAREILTCVAENTPGGRDSHYGTFATGELARLDDSFLAHEILAECNDACYFHELLQRLEPHRLEYVSDAVLPTVVVDNLGRQAASTLRALARDWRELEQYMDFVCNRALRRAILTTAGTPVRRDIDPSAVEALYFYGAPQAEASPVDLAPGRAQTFRFQDRRITLRDALSKALCLELGAGSEHAYRSFDSLHDGALARLGPLRGEAPGSRVAVRDLLLRLLTSGALDFGLTPERPLPPAADGRPRLTPLAQAQLRSGWPPTNTLLAGASIAPDLRRALALLDGSRDLDALAAELAALAAPAPPPPLEPLLASLRAHRFLAAG